MSKRYNGHRLGFRRSALSIIKPAIRHRTRLPHGIKRWAAREESFQVDEHEQLPSVRYLLVIALSPAGVTSLMTQFQPQGALSCGWGLNVDDVIMVS